MLPGFITLYKDNNNLIHLYFFKGLTDNDKPYYHDLDMSNCKYEYKMNVNSDNSIEYIFNDNSIKMMNCKLINYRLEEENFILRI